MSAPMIPSAQRLRIAANQLALDGEPRTEDERRRREHLRFEARAAVVHYARSVTERYELYRMLGLEPEPARDAAPMPGEQSGGRAVSHGYRGGRTPKRRRG